VKPGLGFLILISAVISKAKITFSYQLALASQSEISTVKEA
jgi:hypothetical protein